ILLTTVLITAYAGIPRRIPTKPAILPAASKTVIIVRGCMFNVFPITFGLIKFESVCFAINVMTATQITSIGSWKNKIVNEVMKAIQRQKNRNTFINKAKTANNNAKFKSIIE